MNKRILKAYANARDLPEQWVELAETITEMRDNNGTATQQEVCRFLSEYMKVLEAQMTCDYRRVVMCKDCISSDDEGKDNYVMCLYYGEERCKTDYCQHGKAKNEKEVGENGSLL